MAIYVKYYFQQISFSFDGIALKKVKKKCFTLLVTCNTIAFTVAFFNYMFNYIQINVAIFSELMSDFTSLRFRPT